MKEIEYIVVGLGIAGVSFCEQLLQREKSFKVIATPGNTATSVAGGVMNPVVLKRFTPAWNASGFMDSAVPFYKNIGHALGNPIIEDVSIRRILASVEEMNNWAIASDKRELASFLSSEIEANTNPALVAPFGLGKVLGAKKLYPAKLLQQYADYLQKKEKLISEAFDTSLLTLKTNGFQYKGISTKKIIFAEGAAVIHNPYFRSNIITGNKGEYITIEAPRLQLNSIIKGPVFLIPLGNDRYKAGATFSRDAHTSYPTEEARDTLVKQLSKMLSCPFEVVDQAAGIRPVTKDRRPVLGILENKNIGFFNGLGSRGLFMAPLLAQWLFDFLETGKPLPSEVDIQRFL